MMDHGGFGWRGVRRGSRDRQQPRAPRATLRRALGLFRQHWALGLLLVFIITLSSLVGLVPPLLIRRILDDALPQRDGTEVNVLVVVMVVSALLGSLLGVAQSWLSNLMGQGVMESMRNRLYAHLQRMPLRFFISTRSGEVMSRVTSDVNGVQDVVTNTFGSMLSNLITAVSTIALMMVLDWRLSLLGIAALPLFIWPTRKVGRMQRDMATQQQQRMADLSAHLQESLSVNGALLTKIFGQEEHQLNRFTTINHELRQLSIRRALVGRWFFMFLGLFGVLAPALTYWYGGHAVISGDMQVGTMVALAAYLARLFGPVTQLFSLNVTVESSLALFERLFEYLDLPFEIEERPGAVDLPRAEGRIEFQDVSFKYVEQSWALRDLSFTAEAGQVVALVGPSGAGKTTISYLVPRLFDVNEGAVLLDGVDVRELTLASLARNIAMVTQEPFIFHAGLRENVAYSRPDASDEEIRRVIDDVRLGELVGRLPDGLDTIVGERGYRLSGGEKQRLSIARVLLNDPPVLVLDEATNSLDSESEMAVQGSIAKLMRGRTTIVIAHRLSTVVAADKILVIENGRLVGMGSHTELLATNHLYGRLYNAQFGLGSVGEASLRPAAPDF